jgi:molybdopterin-guanine dinucleotide biosynthesis protein A
VAADLPLLDEAHLAALCSAMDADDFDALVVRAPERLQELLDRLQNAFTSNDFAAVESEAHN